MWKVPTNCSAVRRTPCFRKDTRPDVYGAPSAVPGWQRCARRACIGVDRVHSLVSLSPSDALSDPPPGQAAVRVKWIASIAVKDTRQFHVNLHRSSQSGLR